MFLTISQRGVRAYKVSTYTAYAWAGTSYRTDTGQVQPNRR